MTMHDELIAKAQDGANGGILSPEEKVYLILGVTLALERVEQEARRRAEEVTIESYDYYASGRESALVELAEFCHLQRLGDTP